MLSTYGRSNALSTVALPPPVTTLIFKWSAMPGGVKAGIVRVVLACEDRIERVSSFADGWEMYR